MGTCHRQEHKKRDRIDAKSEGLGLGYSNVEIVRNKYTGVSINKGKM